MATTTSLYGGAASATMDVTTITTATNVPGSGTPDEITENGLDRLIAVDIQTDTSVSSAIIIPKPSQCPVGRKIMVDLRESNGNYYYYVIIKDQTAASNSTSNGSFITNYDRQNGWYDSTYEYPWYMYSQGYAIGETYVPELLILTNNGTEWLADDEADRGEWSTGQNNFAPY